jgi:hypothetical protein
MPEQDDETSHQKFEPDMVAAVRRLQLAAEARNRAHLNAVAETVFLSHGGQPVEQVLAELVRQAENPLYIPHLENFAAAASAISLGRRFAFV